MYNFIYFMYYFLHFMYYSIYSMYNFLYFMYNFLYFMYNFLNTEEGRRKHQAEQRKKLKGALAVENLRRREVHCEGE